MKIAILIAIILHGTTSIAQAPFTSFKDAMVFMTKRADYNDKALIKGITGVVLVSGTIKNGQALGWKIISSPDTSLNAEALKTCSLTSKLWSFIYRETTLIVPFHYDNADKVHYDELIDYDPVLRVRQSGNRDFIVMRSIESLVSVGY